MKTVKINKFREKIKKLLFLQCWAIVGGSGSGSYISLEFGNKIKRNNFLKNPLLSKEFRENVGEYSLFVEECSWRIESDELIIFGSQTSNVAMNSALNNLLNKKVKNIKLNVPALDLEILFEGGFKLIVFCNTMPDDEGDNYTFYSPKNTFTIQSYGNIKVNKRCTD